MATLASVQIADKHSEFGSGAAFLLLQNCPISETILLNPDQEVIIRKDSPYVIARIKGNLSAADMLDETHEVIQRGLDVFSIQGKADLSTYRDVSKCLLWWRDSRGQILRIISLRTLSHHVGHPELEQFDMNGARVPSEPPPSPIYHDSLRYFRLSQVTDDIFDGFRNMYLAFESLLDSIEPKPKRGLGEQAWLTKALKKADAEYDLRKAVRPPVPDADIIEEIVQQLYIDIRCKLFHTKQEEGYLLPQRAFDRSKVEKGLRKLTKLVLFLAENKCKARYQLGYMTDDCFMGAYKPIMNNATVMLSTDNSKCGDIEVHGREDCNQPIEVKALYRPDFSKPGLIFALGSIELAGLGSFPRLLNIELRSGGEPCLKTTLEAELILSGVDFLEAQMGIRLINADMPKHIFNFSL